MRNLRFAALAAIVCAFVAPSIYAIAAGSFSTLPQVGQPTFSGGTSTGSSGTVNTSSVPAGPTFLTGSETIPADTNLAGGAPPQSVTIPVTAFGNYGGTPRNYLDNGAIAVQQRGVGIITGGTTTVPSSAHSADRWGCFTNVTSGAGRCQVSTTVPVPPTGFPASQRLYRTSGALLQPVCMIQEIPTVESTYLAGKTVTFSFYAAALAGLAADNNSQMQAVIISGTGSDEGLQTLTASPAITPAWTGIATALNSTLTITTTYTRYAVSATIPATATEVGVLLCFTPTATGAGTTDGFAFTGAQLEIGSVASPFEFRKYGDELIRAQRFFYKITESATAATTRGSCVNLTSSISNCVVPFPVLMAKVPLMTYATGFGIAVAAQTSYTACTANATSTTATSVASTVAVLMSCATGAAGGALGTATSWGDSGGTGTISASADF